MKKEKGFTLIELLAVIVLLAILMVIAVPKILNVIENSRESAAEISAKVYIDTINKSNTLSEIDNKYKKYEDGDDIDILEITGLHIKGDYPTNGSVTIKNSKVKNANLCILGYEVEYDNNSTIVIGKCSNQVIEKVSKKIYNSIKLNDGNDVIYKSNNTDIANVDKNALVSSNKSGEVVIFVIKNNKKVKMYNLTVDKENNPLIFTSGKFATNNTNGKVFTDEKTLSDLYGLLTDGIYSKQGRYGALLMGGSTKYYLNFDVNSYVTITFSSASYKDSVGSSGKDAIFYKLDSDGNEIEYSRIVTKNNTKNYASVSFEPGKYVLRESGNYIEFDEWELN